MINKNLWTRTLICTLMFFVVFTSWYAESKNCSCITRSFSYPSRSSRTSSRSSSSSYSSSRSHHRPHHYANSQTKENAPMWVLYCFILFYLLFIYLWWKLWSQQEAIVDTSKKRKKKVILGDKDHVYNDYEKKAKWFDHHRSRDFFEKFYLDKVISYLSPRATVLDLGCGMGEPISQYFIEQGYKLTGIDGSQKLIKLAKKRYPQAEFIVADMRTIHFDKKFDCIILWHSFFHLPADDQRAMFAIFQRYLKIDGILMFTSGPQEGEVWSNNGGISMYHASLSPDEYKKLLEEYGFGLLMHVIEDENCGGATVWMARLNYVTSVNLLSN